VFISSTDRNSFKELVRLGTFFVDLATVNVTPVVVWTDSLWFLTHTINFRRWYYLLLKVPWQGWYLTMLGARVIEFVYSYIMLLISPQSLAMTWSMITTPKIEKQTTALPEIDEKTLRSNRRLSKITSWMLSVSFVKLLLETITFIDRCSLGFLHKRKCKMWQNRHFYVKSWVNI